MPIRIINLVVFLFFITTTVYANTGNTTRIPQFSNSEVTVWETIIYPSKNQILKLHRHDHNRVVVVLEGGTLKITNDQGNVHYLKLEKGHVYYLSKDIPHELHKDENISKHVIKVFVIELKN